MKNYLFACAASAKIKRLCLQRSSSYGRVAVWEVGTYAEKKIVDMAHELDAQLLLSA